MNTQHRVNSQYMEMILNGTANILIQDIGRRARPEEGKREISIQITDEFGIVEFEFFVHADTLNITPIGNVMLDNDQLDPPLGLDPTEDQGGETLATIEARLQAHSGCFSPESTTGVTIRDAAPKWELWYNAEYAKAHNPTLMHIGTTGGFGCHRAMMRKAVENGAMVEAENYFWLLVGQTIRETWKEYVEPEGGDLEEYLNQWFCLVMEETATAWDEYKPFIRPRTVGSPYSITLENFINRYVLL